MPQDQKHSSLTAESLKAHNNQHKQSPRVSIVSPILCYIADEIRKDRPDTNMQKYLKCDGDNVKAFIDQGGRRIRAGGA